MTAPSLATRARAALDAAGVPLGATLLVACSGGLDSQVLLDVLAHVASRGRIALVAHGVDHGLRAEAAAELSLAAELARARSIPFDVSTLAVERGSNLQARARSARFEALRSVAARVGALRIATAHHRDDRAETVLIRILRGAPLAGLDVLPIAQGDLVRPLVHARRVELEAHAHRRRLAYATDPSNVDRRHLRARVRHDVLPLLHTLDPRIVDHLARLADDAAELDRLPARAAVRHAVGDASSRAGAAVYDAAIRGDARARVLLKRGRVALWDQSKGIVISEESHGGAAALRRNRRGGGDGRHEGEGALDASRARGRG